MFSKLLAMKQLLAVMLLIFSISAFAIDADSDGIDDASDNCPNAANANQIDTDGDIQGDVCDADPTHAELASAVQIGYQHSCVLTSMGAVKCWGDNNYGQLGDSSDTGRLRPVDVVGLNGGVTAIEASGYYNCALIGAGAVKCWGANLSGQLGDGSTTQRNTPVDVVGMSSGVTEVSVGGNHSCALSSGAVKCWGNNDHGQLGDNSITQRNTPVNVVGLSGGVTAIAAGLYHSCALTSLGSVKCWGSNSYGQLGDNSTTQRKTPVNVVGLSSGVKAISVGNDYSCALTGAGVVKCWGANFYGQLGDNTTVQRNTPADVVGLSSGATAIAAGVSYACAITSAGAMKCWGSNYVGQLGDSSTTNRLTPVDVMGLSSGVTAIAARLQHSCALTSVGAVKCWGRNYEGQLGDNYTENRFTPADVVGLSGDSDGDGIGDLKDNCPLNINTDQLDTDGDLLGDVCDVDDDNDGVPDISDAFSSNSAEWLDTDSDGIGNNADIDDDNDGVDDINDAFPLDATEWLDTDGDGIGNNADTTPYGTADSDNDTLPDLWEQANGRDPLKADYMVSAGGFHSCALDNSGVKCWGNYSYGQTAVPALSSPSMVSAGFRHTCAIDTTGVKCWGAGVTNTGAGDNFGQSITPALANPTAVSAGYWHTCAIDAAGVQCWGKNDYGQTTVPLGLVNPVMVSAGKHHTCALDVNGVHCWGANYIRQTKVPALVGALSVSAGDTHSCTVDQDGVKCWGRNSAGQTNVPALALPQLSAAGMSHSCAFDSGDVVCWGDNAFGQTTVPALITPASVDAGLYHSCALDSAGVHCWGRNNSGQATVPVLDFTHP